jgi:hypothetical protein
MNDTRTQHTQLIKQQRKLYRGTAAAVGVIAMLSYAPSFIHAGLLKVDPSAASRIRLWGLVVALFVVSGVSLYDAYTAWRAGFVISAYRVVYRSSHRLEYLVSLSFSVLTALLAPAVLLLLLFVGVMSGRGDR